MSDKQEIGLHFGLFADRIAKQLRKQKLPFDHDEIRSLQVVSDAISMLYLHDYLTDAAKQKARQRLFNEIKKHVKGRMKKTKPSTTSDT